MFELNNFDSIQIGVASPEKIRSWSHGEVKKPETINYRTQKPEKDGLFCEVIFGPTKDWECHCGKYKRIKYKGIVCDKCGVEVTKKKVRRERMGHIELAAPVSHIWYFKGLPSRISVALDMSPKDVECVLYLSKYVVIDPGTTDFVKKQVINDAEFNEAVEKFGKGSFRAGMGAEAVKELLTEIDLEKESAELKELVSKSTGPKRIKAVKRLEIIEAFRVSGNRPEWMILDVIPVLPPELRPMVPLDGGRFAASDLNELYRRVITRNNRLKKLIESGAPDIMLRNEKRILQEAVDALIDNGKKGKPATGPSNRELRSLSGLLKGKQGRFRQNLLGKRVDYSGRSVIVVGPELQMHQCGLPKEMALELFKPFVMKKLVDYGKTQNIKSAKKLIDKQDPKVWDILEEVIKDHPVLLNRAPTLHRLGIQAFEPVLVEGRAIKLHPLACGAFNADFDGDQMAVHVPLSLEAQAEARILMLATNNILKLADGRPIVTPTQDMVIGSYYLTIRKDDAKGAGKWFSSPNEALMAYALKEVALQAPVHVRVEKMIDGELKSKIIETTTGRIIFNQAIPQDLGFVDRSNPDLVFNYEIDDNPGEKMVPICKSQLSKIVDRCFQLKGATGTAQVLDKIKAQGYKYSTIGAITTSVFDMNIPVEKHDILAKAEADQLKIEKMYQRGILTDEDRYNQIIDMWTKAKEELDGKLAGALGEFNPIWMMSHSGARGSMGQIAQLCGMRGLVKDPTGRTVELPVKASYREGLSVLEYFISSHGGRKGLADTALKTADSGYLTRRLVDVAQDVIVNEQDCGDTKGTLVVPIMNGATLVEELWKRIDGRYTVSDIVDFRTGEVIVPRDTMILPDKAKEIDAMVKARVADLEARGEKVTKEDRGIYIRSTLSCKTKHGVCAKCYGKNMASGNPVKIGEAVGVIAAQSIGEPGTQLTMRTFHSGGVAAGDDITQGLPRVEELFEARKPKGEAVITEINGTVKVADDRRLVTVTPENGDAKEYKIAFTQKIIVRNGDLVEAGQALTSGSINPQDMLRARGVRGVQEYLMNQVQIAYRTSGVETNDKHAEIIIRQMMRKVRIEDSGDTDMLPGQLVDLFTYDEENEKTLDKGGRPAKAKRTLLGVTPASLAAESFLSAASFQQTSTVLTDAAVKNKVDHLRGLKENVILGKLIPAGTGMKCYKSVGVTSAEQNDSVIVENRSHEDQLKLEEDIED